MKILVSLIFSILFSSCLIAGEFDGEMTNKHKWIYPAIGIEGVVIALSAIAAEDPVKYGKAQRGVSPFGLTAATEDSIWPGVAGMALLGGLGHYNVEELGKEDKYSKRAVFEHNMLAIHGVFVTAFLLQPFVKTEDVAVIPLRDGVQVAFKKEF